LMSTATVVALLGCRFAGGAGAGTIDSRSLLPTSGRDFYVDPKGDDANAGTSAQHPWRTLARADAAHLRPGDRVHLRGGATFPEPLAPYARTAGTARLPIVFDSYGGGRANVRGGIFLSSVSNLVFSDLRVISPSGKGVFSSAGGGGARSITLRNVAVADTPLAGISSNNRLDADWRIEGVVVSHTGDSGIYFVGSHFTIDGSTITHTGRRRVIPYPRHAIYAKGNAPTIVGNIIRDFSTSGISLRRQGGRVEGNLVSSGRKGISFDDEATAPGTTRVACNTIRDVSDSGIAINSAASERFVLVGNAIVDAGRYGVYSETVPALTLAHNVVQVRSAAGALLGARSSIGRYGEHDNVWYAGRMKSVVWDGSPRSLSTYAGLSGQARHDVVLSRPIGPLVSRRLAAAHDDAAGNEECGPPVDGRSGAK